MKSTYKNKHIIITGRSKIKLTNFLKTLAAILKIKKKVRFKNKKIIGHYVLSPYTFVPKAGKKFNIKSEINFKEGLRNLIDKTKNNIAS